MVGMLSWHTRLVGRCVGGGWKGEAEGAGMTGITYGCC